MDQVRLLALLLVIGLFAVVSASEVPFADPETIRGVTEAGALATAADIDGDGDLDAVVSQDPDLVWLRNNGGSPGTWPRRVIHSATFRDSIGTADLDGDGDLDVFATNRNGEVSWFENNGALPPAWTRRLISSGENSQPDQASLNQAVSADLDADGDLDLAVTRKGPGGGVIWFESDGAAPPAWTRRVVVDGTGYNGAASADVDGDGDLDLIAVTQAVPGNIQWFANNGDSPVSWAGPLAIGQVTTESFHVAAGDIDGDGDLDVVSPGLAGADDPGLSWFENNGAPLPGWAPHVVSPVAEARVHGLPRLVDLDQDGDLDIVVPVAGGDDLAFYENDGASTPGWTRDLIAVGLDDLSWISTGDLDRDGDPDILSSSSVIALHENRTIHRSAAFPELVAVTNVASAFATDPIAIGDVDGDGDLDLAIGVTDGINLLYLNNGTADAWDGVAGLDITTDAQPTRRVVLGDFDGDGKLDFVSANQRAGGPVSRLYLSNGTADPFDGVIGKDLDSGIQVFAMKAGDLDGDGDLDLVSAENPLRVLLNNGSADPFGGVTALTYPTVGVDRLQIADLDGDGDLDLVKAGAGAFVMLNNGTGDPFSGVEDDQLGTDTSARRDSAVGDVDGDGDLDIVVGGVGPTPVLLYTNNGTADPFGGVLEMPVVTADEQTSFVALADLDADGDLDLVRTGLFTVPEVFYNNGTARPFQKVTGVDLLSPPSDTRDLVIADVDGDGKLDILTSNTGLDASPGVKWFPNRGGQFANTAADCYAGPIREGEEELLASVDLKLNARPGDSPGRVASTRFDLGLEPADLSTALATLRLYRDNGDGEFGAADVLLTAVDVVTFVGGVGGLYDLQYPVDDPNGILAAPARFFLTGQVDPNASASGFATLEVSNANGNTIVTDANAGVPLTEEDDGLGSSCTESRPIFRTLVVNDTSDGVDAAPGDSNCATATGTCTLRAAIMEASALTGARRIALPAGIFRPTIAGDDDTGLTGDLDIQDDLTIVGAGASATIIDGQLLGDRLFHVLGPAEVVFQDLSVTAGAAAGDGGGLWVTGSAAVEVHRSFFLDNTAAANGGGISAGAGSLLRIVDSRIAGNSALGGTGGGVHSTQTVYVQRSEISGNGAASGGGGLYTDSVMQVLTSTISGNDAGSGDGGGVLAEVLASVAFSDSTIAQNNAASGAGVSICTKCIVTTQNSILADNKNGANDCSGNLLSSGYTLIKNTDGCILSRIFPGGPNLLDVDPLLGPLGDYGGSTLTHRLRIGSPAIDGGLCGGPAAARDQTGQARPVDDLNTLNAADGCDLGAYEARLGEIQERIEIPIRWCGLRGAPSIEDPGLVGQNTANDVMRRRHEVASDEIYLPQAGIAFRSGGNFIIEDYPILEDPSCVEGAQGSFSCDAGVRGDVMLDLDTGDFSEFTNLVASCRAAWEALDPNIQGITAVHVNRFVDPAGNLLDVLGVGGRAQANDIADQQIAGRVMVVDNNYRLDANPADTVDRLLGHEMGHALSLLHGNGLDDDSDTILDNNDETAIGVPRFDGSNLLQYRNGDALTGLQAEQIRDHAKATIPDATETALGPASQPSSDSIANEAQLDEENAQILQFGYQAVVELENEQIPQFENAQVLQFENAQVLEFENAQIPQFENEQIPQFENAQIPQFGMEYTSDEPAALTTFNMSLARLPWPAPIRPDTRYYFYLDLDTSDSTGGYPAEFPNPSDAGNNFPGTNNLLSEPPVGEETGVDMILQIMLASACPGRVCESTAELLVFDFNDTTQAYELVLAELDLKLTAYRLGLYRDTGGADPEVDEVPVGFTIRATLPNSVLFDAGWGFQPGPDGPVPEPIGIEVLTTIECSGRILNDDLNSAIVDCQCEDCGDCPNYPGCVDGVGTPKDLTDSRIVADQDRGRLTFEPALLPRSVVAPVLAQEGQFVTVYVFDLPTDVTGQVEVSLGDVVLGTVPTTAIDANGGVSLTVQLPFGVFGEQTLSSGITGFAPRATTVVTISPSLAFPDNDGDGIPDDIDPDDDNDSVSDVDETAGGSDPLNPLDCGDSDKDTCDDCISATLAPARDGPDFDLDGLCNAGDPDDDNDGVLDALDEDPFNADACGDSDADTCDDCSVAGSFDPANDGLDTDGDGLCDRGDANVNAPVVGPITAPMDPLPVGMTITASASFTDADSNAHTAEWDWGDGTTSAGTVTEAGGAGDVEGDHTYTEPGVYRIRLTVNDGVNSGESEFEFVVIFGRDGGFVTGGGWIDSPPGAYTAAPTLAGKVSFGFVSKIRSGATRPTGGALIRFKLADVRFISTVYDWLVIAGHTAQFAGSGKINGKGNYGFLLSAIDERLTESTDVDLFRIKIWDKDAGDTVVYDNLLGGPDDQPPATELGGGAIVIHSFRDTGGWWHW